MSSQEEGDYVDMSGLVFTYLPVHSKQNTLLLLFNDCTCDTCYFLKLFLFLMSKSSFILCFRILIIRRPVHNHPCQGQLKKGEYLKILALLLI